MDKAIENFFCSFLKELEEMEESEFQENVEGLEAIFKEKDNTLKEENGQFFFLFPS